MLAILSAAIGPVVVLGLLGALVAIPWRPDRLVTTKHPDREHHA